MAEGSSVNLSTEEEEDSVQVPVKGISHTWNHAEVLSLLSAYKTHEDKFRNHTHKPQFIYLYNFKENFISFLISPYMTSKSVYHLTQPFLGLLPH